MNSARRAREAKTVGARKKNAGRSPALVCTVKKRFDCLIVRPLVSEEARPQDWRVSMCVGTWSSAFTWRLCGSVVNSVVDRCLLNNLIEQLNNGLFFTRKKY
jgi:hypothetical protein